MNDSKAKGFFYRMFCGFFLGVSVIAPGVSGSIMAVMMGIYDHLINIISNPFKNFKKNVIYLIPMGIGAVLSVLICIKLFDWLFEYHTIPAYLLFMGLIGGSLGAVFKEANSGGFKKSYGAGAVLAFIFALAVGIFAKNTTTASVESASVLYLSASGLIAGITGMIPGMSVSMVLMLLGVYEPLLKMASGFQLLPIIPVGIAFVAGMILFSQVIKFIFTRYRGMGYFIVFGFMVGTMISIFPGIPQGALEWIMSVLMIAIGVGISVVFQKLGEKFNAEE